MKRGYCNHTVGMAIQLVMLSPPTKQTSPYRSYTKMRKAQKSSGDIGKRRRRRTVYLLSASVLTCQVGAITHFKFNINVERSVVAPDEVNPVHLACRQKSGRQRTVVEPMQDDDDDSDQWINLVLRSSDGCLRRWVVSSLTGP